MTEILIRIMITWALINMLTLFVLPVTAVKAEECRFVNPIFIYNKIKVNWFGAWLLAIILNILLPAVAIYYWIYKLCTIGRK